MCGHETRSAVASFILPILIAGLVALLPVSESRCEEMTGDRLLKKVAEKALSESFRIVLDIRTRERGKVSTEHGMWLMGRTQDGQTSLFLDFEAPEESAGMRFLFKLKPDVAPDAYMHLPAANRTVPLDAADPQAEIGSTGLTMGDVRALVPKRGEEGKIVGEETVDGMKCYVVEISPNEGKGRQKLWIAKDDLVIVKGEQKNEKGKTQRSFKVVEFFTTESGRKFPRKEIIKVPPKKMVITVTQVHALFSVELPDEIFDPETFGTYKWRI